MRVKPETNDGYITEKIFPQLETTDKYLTSEIKAGKTLYDRISSEIQNEVPDRVHPFLDWNANQLWPWLAERDATSIIGDENGIALSVSYDESALGLSATNPDLSQWNPSVPVSSIDTESGPAANSFGFNSGGQEYEWSESLIKWKLYSNGSVTMDADQIDFTSEVTTGPRIKNTYLGKYDAQIIGNDHDNVIKGADFWAYDHGGRYFHINDRIYGGGGNDTIYGYGGRDVLSGGSGDDVIYGGNHNDLLYGGTGSDILMGENGNDILYGGADDDILFGGAGTDTLYGGSGDDWLSAGPRVGGGGDELHGGSGHDVFVISDFEATPPAEAPQGSSNDPDVILDKAVWDFGFAAMKFIPGVGQFASIGKLAANMIRAVGEGASPAAPVPNHTIDPAQIKDFDPTQDSIVLGINPHIKGSPSIDLKASADAMQGLDLKDGNGNVLANVTWDALSNWLDPSLDLNNQRVIDALKNYFVNSMRIISVEEGGAVTITDRFGNDIDTSGDFSNLQPGKYVILGAYQGTVATGTSSSDIVFGTDHGDVLYGYSNSGDSHAEVSNDEIFGYGGDDFIDAGAGDNMIYGGEGMDVSSYATASAGINVDLSQKTWDHSNEPRQFVLVKHQHTQAGGNVVNGRDYLYEIEGIQGTGFADTLRGDTGDNWLDGGAGHDWLFGGGGDDTIASGSGDDSIEGGAGADLFVLDGGHNSVRDFSASEGDQLRVDFEAYGITSLHELATQIDSNGNTRLYVESTGLPVATLTLVDKPADGFNALDSLTGIDANGNVVEYVSKGTDGNDHIIGRSDAGFKDEIIFAGGGNDTIEGRGGDDLIFGQSGNNRLDGGSGNDTLVSGTGADTLLGGTGDDILIASGGVDAAMFLYGGDGDDILVNEGTDSHNAPIRYLNGGAGADTFVIKGGGQMFISDFDESDTIAFDLEALGLSSLDEIEFAQADDYLLAKYGDNGSFIIQGGFSNMDQIKTWTGGDFEFLI